ncbi:MAG: LysM peptidoglycan-binding domain-containing protein [Treponema sp.]|nr:LysM peptidoglycan-binding domain-containing protein [Treponema sp.]
MKNKFIIIPAIALLFAAQAVVAQDEDVLDIVEDGEQVLSVESEALADEFAAEEVVEDEALVAEEFPGDEFVDDEVLAEEFPAEEFASDEVLAADEFAENEVIADEFAEDEFAEEEVLVVEVEIPAGIRNNRYFLESERLTVLAQQAFDEGDFLTSTEYSEEAVRFAALSDEYVRLQLIIWETDNIIASARERLTFATAAGAATRYPEEYSEAQAAYAEARSYRAAESWDEAVDAAYRVLVALANISDLPVAAGRAQLPSQYTVRSWAEFRDSLWTIAGRSWAFNDPRQWRRLYEANRNKMPQTGNPDLIHPGMILDIPSIRGETRQGMWQPGVQYPPLP